MEETLARAFFGRVYRVLRRSANVPTAYTVWRSTKNKYNARNTVINSTGAYKLIRTHSIRVFSITCPFRVHRVSGLFFFSRFSTSLAVRAQPKQIQFKLTGARALINFEFCFVFGGVNDCARVRTDGFCFGFVTRRPYHSRLLTNYLIYMYNITEICSWIRSEWTKWKSPWRRIIASRLIRIQIGQEVWIWYARAREREKITWRCHTTCV